MATRCVRPLHAAMRGVWGSSQVRLRDGVLSEALMAFSASPRALWSLPGTLSNTPRPFAPPPAEEA